jgi:flagellar basal-body rod protein FlgB
MSKTSEITNFLEAGIRAENLRQKSIANNIANLETPNYRRIDIKFEELLARSLDSKGSADLDNIDLEFYSSKSTPVNSNGNDVNLETEIGELVKNSLRYKTYIRLLNKKYAQIALAMDIK